MGEFVLGSLMAQLYAQLRGRKPGRSENAVGTVVFLAAAASMIPITYLMYAPDVGLNIFRKMYMNYGLAPSAALLVFCAARYRNVFSRLLTSPPALVLGDASYSIYLVHYVVLMIATKLIGSATHGAIFHAVALILSTIAILVVSILLYTYYEVAGPQMAAPAVARQGVIRNGRINMAPARRAAAAVGCRAKSTMARP